MDPTIEASAESLGPEEDLERNWLATVSHEMRSTLQSMVLGVGLADQLAGRDVRGVRRHLKHVHDNAMVLSRLMADLIDAARVRELQVLPVDCDLSHLVRESVEMFEGLRAHEADFELPAAMHGLADPDRFRQIVRNLLSNAEKYSVPGRLHIGGVEAGRYSVVTFQDEGPGIDERDQLRLFARHVRLPSQREGLGIGLWLSQRLARAMDGDLWVESSRGGPSTFFLVLPAAPIAQQAS